MGTGVRTVIDASRRTRPGWGTATAEKVRSAGAVVRSVDKMMIEGRNPSNDESSTIEMFQLDLPFRSG